MEARSDVVASSEDMDMDMDMGSTTELNNVIDDDSAPPTKSRKETPSTNSSGIREIFSFGPPPNTSGKTLSSSSMGSPFWIPDSPFADSPLEDHASTSLVGNEGAVGGGAPFATVPTAATTPTSSQRNMGIREIFGGVTTPPGGNVLSTTQLGSYWEPNSPFADSPLVEDEMDDLPDNLTYTVQKGEVRTFKKSTAIDTNYNVHLSNAWMGMTMEDALNYLGIVFSRILNLVQGDLTRVVIICPDLDNPLVISSRELMTVDDILSTIEKTMTSFADLSITKGFQIKIGVINYPKGSGKKKYVTNLSRDIPSKRSIAQIKNEDSMCAIRAVAVAYTKSCIVHNDIFTESVKGMSGTMVDKVLKSGKATASFYKNIAKGDKEKNREQYNMSKKLAEMANIDTSVACHLYELGKLENIINRNICVIQAEEGNNFVRKATDANRENIYLYLYDNHYDAIISMTGFFSSSYFCNDCLQPFSTKNKHHCEAYCNTCTSKNCKLGTSVNCPHCNQVCRNNMCLLRHTLVPYKKTNMCKAWYRCLDCHKVMPSERKDKHQCGEWFCDSCESWVDADHLCYMRTVDPPEQHHCQFVFYDFETTQETKYICENGYEARCPSGCSNCDVTELCSKCSLCTNCANPSCNAIRHTVNLVVAKTVCDTCLNLDTLTCEVCGRRCETCKDQTCMQCPKTRQNVFRDTDSFCQWLLSEQYQNFTCIAHNAKAFDSYFILDYLSRQGIPPRHAVYNGSKIMHFVVEKGLNIRFVDSLNFFAMPLSALPKAFGFQELKKGYFPHYFNKFENRDYVGTLPDPSHYGVDDMTPDGREAFLAWHAKRLTDGPFDFDRELIEYCKSDVDILSTACLKYRQLMIESTDVDPWGCATVASTSMKVYKTNFLREHWTVQLPGGSVHDAVYQGGKFKIKVNGDQVQGLIVADKQFVSTPIARVPATGYSTRVTYSRSSIQWLEWLRHSTNADIGHALNGRGEDKIGGHYVDGRDGQTIYEFNGCFWHGCPHCYKIDRSTVKHPRTQQSMNELYALTLKKQEKLEELGYTVITKWEHEFHEELKTNPEMKNYVDSLDLVERLNPRDSFFGGRTNALRLHYKVKPDTDEEIRYVDFTSLYPYVNKYKECPVGHPEIITDNFKDLKEYFGIAKVKVLPPRGLYLPVLPFKSNGKLKFPLCKTCADSECQTPCECSDAQRALTGTWCIIEILKALEMGYTLLKIYEVYHFKETSKGLFSEYVNTFLKYKQESSGWPEWCNNEDNKQEYIKNYKENEGIDLEYDKIQKNPGLRSLSKSKLNNFWGKFGQRNNFTKTTYFTGTQLPEFYQLLSDTTKEIKNFHIINEKLITVEYCNAENQTLDDTVSNIFIATFTTAHARLHLYGVMEELGERVLYHDTDSVVYVHKPNLNNPTLGDYLGQLTDELNGDSITEFVSAGPKNYAYKTKLGKEVCKVRGFRLNHANTQLINFATVKNIVTSDKTMIVDTKDMKILRDKTNMVLYNKCRNKRYRFVYTKRRIVDEVYTLPFGY